MLVLTPETLTLQMAASLTFFLKYCAPPSTMEISRNFAISNFCFFDLGLLVPNLLLLFFFVADPDPDSPLKFFV